MALDVGIILNEIDRNFKSETTKGFRNLISYNKFSNELNDIDESDIFGFFEDFMKVINEYSNSVERNKQKLAAKVIGTFFFIDIFIDKIKNLSGKKYVEEKMYNLIFNFLLENDYMNLIPLIIFYEKGLIKIDKLIFFMEKFLKHQQNIGEIENYKKLFHGLIIYFYEIPSKKTFQKFVNAILKTKNEEFIYLLRYLYCFINRRTDNFEEIVYYHFSDKIYLYSDVDKTKTVFNGNKNEEVFELFFQNKFSEIFYLGVDGLAKITEQNRKRILEEIEWMIEHSAFIPVSLLINDEYAFNISKIFAEMIFHGINPNKPKIYFDSLKTKEQSFGLFIKDYFDFCNSDGKYEKIKNTYSISTARGVCSKLGKHFTEIVSIINGD